MIIIHNSYMSKAELEMQLVQIALIMNVFKAL